MKLPCAPICFTLISKIIKKHSVPLANIETLFIAVLEEGHKSMNNVRGSGRLLAQSALAAAKNKAQKEDYD